jgi:DNA-binding MarR family transcriptional regulator
VNIDEESCRRCEIEGHEEAGELGTFFMLQRKLLMQRMNLLGVFPAQGACLYHLLGHEDISQWELAQEMKVARPTVTTMLQKMEKLGLLTRQVDEKDQRLTRISLTDDGRKIAAEAAKTKKEILCSTFGRLEPEEQQQLLNILRRLCEFTKEAMKESEENV